MQAFYGELVFHEFGVPIIASRDVAPNGRIFIALEPHQMFVDAGHLHGGPRGVWVLRPLLIPLEGSQDGMGEPVLEGRVVEHTRGRIDGFQHQVGTLDGVLVGFPVIPGFTIRFFWAVFMV